MTKFCPECGTQQRDDHVKYCSNCGFDFSKIENREDNRGISSDTIKIDISDSEDSNKSSPFSVQSVGVNGSNKSSPSSVQSVGVNGSNKSSPKASTPRINDSKKSPSSGQINKSTSSNGLLSNLSFNKCLLAFAALMVLLLIIGMISQATETQPTSDHGLTSFMESSGAYDSNSFIDNSYYYDDSDSNSNYLSNNVLSVQKMTDLV